MDIATAISSTATLLGIAKGALESRDDQKAQQAITQVQSKLLEVTTAALSLSQTNIALTEEIRELRRAAEDAERIAAERSGYELAEITDGSFAYRSVGSESSSPIHFLCQPCYDKTTKSVLRRRTGAYGDTFWECPENLAHRID